MACSNTGSKSIFPCETLTPSGAAFYNSYYNEGRIIQQYINILHTDIPNFINVIVEQYGIHHVIVSHHSENYGDYSYIVHDDFAILLSKRSLSYSITIVAEPDCMQNLVEIAYDYRMESNNSIRFYTYYIDAEGKLQNSDKTIYSSDYATTIQDDIHQGIDVNNMVEKYLDVNDCLLLLAGKPGTGKSTIVKQVIKALSLNKDRNINIAYVKDERALKDPELWVRLMGDFDAIIFDDLDNNLKERTGFQTASGLKHEISENSFVNQLLSFSEGVVETDTKIIITTNQKLENIDEAIVRPGRCFDVLDVPFMNKAYTRDLWVNKYNLPETKFDDLFPEDEIMQAKFLNEMKKITTGSKSYLRDKSISKQNEITSSRVKLGFINHK